MRAAGEREAAEAAEAGKRKQDPVYHVFRVYEESQSEAQPTFELLTEGAPVKAPNRKAAVSAAAPRPELGETETERREVFMVIAAGEFQVIPRTTRVTVDESFE